MREHSSTLLIQKFLLHIANQTVKHRLVRIDLLQDITLSNNPKNIYLSRTTKVVHTCFFSLLLFILLFGLHFVMNVISISWTIGDISLDL